MITAHQFFKPLIYIYVSNAEKRRYFYIIQTKKMKAKLLIVGKVSEQLVATFATPAEAFHCGSLLQASTEDTNLWYYVEHKGKREMVDPFTRRLPFLNKATQEALKNYYK